MIRVNLLAREVRAGRTNALALAVRKWVAVTMVAVVVLGAGWFAVTGIAEYILREPRETMRNEPARQSPFFEHGVVTARPAAAGQFGTLRVVTGDQEAFVYVGNELRGGGVEVELQLSTRRRYLVTTKLSGKERAEWFKLKSGEQRVWRVSFDASSTLAERRPAVAEPPREQADDESSPVVGPAPASTPPPAVGKTKPFTPEVDKLDEGNLAWLVADTYGMPACLLWAIWKKESNLLTEGQRENRMDWWPAGEAVENGGKCVQKFGEKCERHWKAIISLCAQERNGQPICDPDQIWSSRALAIGPMQHMPGELAEPCKDNRNEYCFTRAAQDFNADQVFDPWQLPDALAATAFKLTGYHAVALRKHEAKPWRWAAIRYYSMPKDEPMRHARYYDDPRRGVKQFWDQCCRETGRCPAPASSKP